jgi:hypothetical protein
MNENLQDRILIKLNDWWNTYAHLFRGWLQREVFRTNNPTKDADYIPNIEITNKYRKTNNGLLMIGCNPSGNDYAYYRDKGNKCDFCIYDKENQYTTAIYNFANNVNCADNYACIDLFPIVLGKEALHSFPTSSLRLFSYLYIISITSPASTATWMCASGAVVGKRVPPSSCFPR